MASIGCFPVTAANSAMVSPSYPVERGPLGTMLAGVVRHIGHYPIRVRGTFCGSLANADPAAEWGLVAATLDAEMVAVSTAGERRVAASDFFQGAMTTALKP